MVAKTMVDWGYGPRVSVFARSFCWKLSAASSQLVHANLKFAQRRRMGVASERLEAAPFVSICGNRGSRLGVCVLIAAASSTSASVGREEESKSALEVLEACLSVVDKSESGEDETKLANHIPEDDLLRKFLNSRIRAVDGCEGRFLTEKAQRLVLNPSLSLSKDSSPNSTQKLLTGSSSGGEAPKQSCFDAIAINRTFTEKATEINHIFALEKGYEPPSNSEEHTDLLTRIEKLLADNQSLEDHLDFLSKHITTENGNLVMRMLGEKHLGLQALTFFQWMKSQDPCLVNTRSYSIIFKYLGQEGMAEQALVLFKNMPEAKGYHCIHVYNSLLGALLKCGRSHEVLELFNQLESKGIEPDPMTFSLLITAARKGRNGLKGAWNLFTLLVKKLDETSSIFACGTLIKAFCDEGLHKDGLLLAVELEKLGTPLNVVIYNTLIDAYGKSGELEEAEGLFSEMVAKGVHPNESTYNTLINAYGRVGQYEVGEALLKEMYKRNLTPNVITYTSLMNAYGKEKLSLKAADVFLRMKNSGIVSNTYAYTALIHAYSEGGWHEKAAMALENMKREGLTPTVEIYTTLLDGFRRARDVERVKETWKEMRQCGCVGTRITLNVLVDSFAKQGLYEDVRNVIYEFGKLDLRPDKMTYNMLINAYARGGRHDQVQRIIEEMKAAGFKPDSYTFTTVIYAFLRVRDFKAALKYHDEMCKANQRPDSKSYRKMKAILEAKLARKLDNDRKANQGQLWKRDSPMKRRRKFFRKSTPA